MLGICVVYLAQGPEGFALLDRSQSQLKRHTRGPHRIYGCCPDNDGATCRRLEEQGVVLLPVKERNPDVSQEHSTLLDMLVGRAVEDGCEHVATFDMDSWPVQDGWDELYPPLLSAEVPLAAIVRTEMRDNFPFAAFLLLRADFWRPGLSSFSARQGLMRSEEGSALATRRDQTGSGILAQLHDEGQRFLRLERSNVWNLHPVIAAIYDNTVFHLGAGSRGPRFISDEASYQIAGRPARRRFADRMNEIIRNYARAEVLERHDEFIAELAGEERRPLLPIETEPRGLQASLSWTPLASRQVMGGT